MDGKRLAALPLQLKLLDRVTLTTDPLAIVDACCDLVQTELAAKPCCAGATVVGRVTPGGRAAPIAAALSFIRRSSRQVLARPVRRRARERAREIPGRISGGPQYRGSAWTLPSAPETSRVAQPVRCDGAHQFRPLLL